MDFRIKVAGKSISIHPFFAQTADYFYSYMEENQALDQADMHICTTASDIETELEYVKAEKNKDTADDSPLPGVLELEYFSILRKIAEAMPSYDTFLMHGSVIETNGFAYMITAPSGTGKTTRTKIWLEEIPNSRVINGDKPLLRVEDHQVYACGTPWCGKEGWNTNTEAPLRAIFLLERIEEGKEAELTELTFSQAFPTLLQQTYRSRDPEAMVKTLHLLKTLDGGVKIYRFRSAPTRGAVVAAYETVNQETVP